MSNRLYVGDRVYCFKTNRVSYVKSFDTVKIGDRDVMTVQTNDGITHYYDELLPRTRIVDSFWGRLFYGKR